MDTIHSTIRTKAIHLLAAVALIGASLLAGGFGLAYAAPPSPFVGHWQATDVDGSDMGLNIGGRPAGPFQITWTDDYISFCSGEAGIVRGTGWLNEGDPNLLAADVHLECFTTGATLDFHATFRYHPATNTLSVRYSFGQVTIWHRPGQPPPPPPTLNLRVNYGHDWVESFYEGGHTAWISVADGDGNIKATIELVTEPKWYWGGETGFQSLDSIWSDADGNQMENPPDIQPNDWMFGWVDNGASAQVQIGEISGTIDLAADSIGGTIYAPWFTDPAQVECLDWGSGQEPPFSNKDGGFKFANGDDPYSCSWAGEWDIQPGQDVGVGYFGPDGHWVANAFTAPNPRIVASESGNWFWTVNFYPGILDLFIYESADEGAALLWSGQSEADQWGFTIVGYDVHGQDLVPGNYLVVSDGVNEKGVVLERITMEVFDTENEIMAGTAPAGREVMVVAGMAEAETQATIRLFADAESGAWMADFSTIPFDITEDMRPWSFAQIFDEDGDANEAGMPPPGPTFVAYMPATIVGYNWPIGETIDLNIEGKYTAQAEVGNADWDPSIVLFELWRDNILMGVGDHIVMTDEATGITKEVWVTNLAVTDFDLSAGTVSGIYDPAYDLWVWLYDGEGQVPAMDPDNGTWVATFTELPPGAWGGATQWDADGDGTSIDFQVPNTRVVIANQPDWVNSGITVSAGQSFTIEAFGLMNPCSDTYPNGAEYCIFYTPLGAEGVAPYENEFGIFPGPGLRFMALLGRIGDGEPFYVGAGGTFAAEQGGTLWFTPNDNLRTDNQGAYSVLVWLEP